MWKETGSVVNGDEMVITAVTALGGINNEFRHLPFACGAFSHFLNRLVFWDAMTCLLQQSIHLAAVSPVFRDPIESSAYIIKLHRTSV